MASPTLGRRARWAPPVHAQIDWAHPLAQGLKCYIPANRVPMVERVSGRLMTNRGSPTGGAASEFGSGVDCAATTNKGCFLDISASGDPLKMQPPITLAWVGRQQTSPGGGGTWFGASYDSADTGPYAGWIFQANGGTFVVQLNTNIAGSYNSINGTTVMTTYRGPLVLVGVITTSTRELWVNGVREATGTAVSSINYSAAELQVGTYVASISRGSGGIVNAAFAWNRQLSAAEIAQFNADPFQMLRW